MHVSTPYQARVTTDSQSNQLTLRVLAKDDLGEERVVAHLTLPGPLRRTRQAHGWRIVVPPEPVSDCQTLPAEPVDWPAVLAHVQAELQCAIDGVAALKEARHQLIVDAQQSGISLAVAGEAMGLTRMRISQIRRRQ